MLLEVPVFGKYVHAHGVCRVMGTRRKNGRSYLNIRKKITTTLARQNELTDTKKQKSRLSRLLGKDE